MTTFTQTVTMDNTTKVLDITSKVPKWEHEEGTDYDVYTWGPYKVRIVYRRKGQGKTQFYISEEGKGGSSMGFGNEDEPIDIPTKPTRTIFVPGKEPGRGGYKRYKPQNPPPKKHEPTPEPVEIPSLGEFRKRIIKGRGLHKISRDLIKRKIVLPSGCTISATVSEKKSNVMIYGRTQSGKTEETCVSMVQRMVLDKCTGLYICRDYTSELEDQTEVMRENIQKIVGDQIQVVPITGNLGWGNLIRSMKTNDNSTLYLVMANTTITNKIFSSFDDGDEIKFTCALDEADMYVKEGSSQINQDLKLLMSAAIRKYFISATLLDISCLIEDDEMVAAIPSKFAFTNEIEGDDRVYRSLHNATRYDPMKIGRKVSDAIENGTLTLQRAIKDRWHVEYNNRGLPFTICHFHSNTNKDNADIAKAISRVVVDNIRAPVITFDQTGVKVYENGVLTRSFDKLKTAMQSLKDENKKVVYMMGGQMCSRSFRVASVDWEMYISLMIYGWTDSSEASLIVQRMGRLCGLTKKELICPQRVFAEKKTFYKAIDCTNITSEFVKTAHEHPTEEFGDMKEMVVLAERLTHVKISNSGVEKEFAEDKKKENLHGGVKEEGDEEIEENEEMSRPIRKETANGALRALFQQEDIGSFESWIAFKGGASYDKVYEWVEKYLGRKLQGTEKQSIRHLVHEQMWYVKK